jgi:hypothetical protein
MSDQVETGRPEGRTSYSDYAEQFYSQAGAERKTLSASEYVAVSEGFLREFVCMGQCNLYIAAVKDEEVKKAIRVYLDDVCNPNIFEMKNILGEGGYPLPAPLEETTSPDKVPHWDTDVINDRMIVIGQWFATRAFMNLWNSYAIMCQRTEVRDAFIRNYHRANRWHVAFHELAMKYNFMPAKPIVEASDLVSH